MRMPRSLYTYAAGSYMQLGVMETRNATDTVNVDTSTGRITQDQESTVVYGSINHPLTPKLMATAVGAFSQYSDPIITASLTTNPLNFTVWD